MIDSTLTILVLRGAQYGFVVVALGELSWAVTGMSAESKFPILPRRLNCCVAPGADNPPRHVTRS